MVARYLHAAVERYEEANTRVSILPHWTPELRALIGEERKLRYEEALMVEIGRYEGLLKGKDKDVEVVIARLDPVWMKIEKEAREEGK
jgi:hypothetical protein